VNRIMAEVFAAESLHGRGFYAKHRPLKTGRKAITADPYRQP
jgi:hypothetical protein